MYLLQHSRKFLAPISKGRPLYSIYCSLNSLSLQLYNSLPLQITIAPTLKHCSTWNFVTLSHLKLALQIWNTFSLPLELALASTRSRSPNLDLALATTLGLALAAPTLVLATTLTLQNWHWFYHRDPNSSLTGTPNIFQSNTKLELPQSTNTFQVT